MAVKKDADVPDAENPAQKATEEVLYMPLRNFADTHALKYGVELMAGFYHEQEKEKNFADTEANWHAKMDEFSTREVK